MWRVRLVTAAGDLVARVLVPRYLRMPEVLCWGTRLFQQSAPDGVYREVVMAAVSTEEEMAAEGRKVRPEAIEEYRGQ